MQVPERVQLAWYRAPQADDSAQLPVRAGERIRDAFSYMQGFATYPYRGTVHPELQGDIRHVTDKGFIYYFEIDELVARIEAIFRRTQKGINVDGITEFHIGKYTFNLNTRTLACEIHARYQGVSGYFIR